MAHRGTLKAQPHCETEVPLWKAAIHWQKRVSDYQCVPFLHTLDLLYAEFSGKAVPLVRSSDPRRCSGGGGGGGGGGLSVSH